MKEIILKPITENVDDYAEAEKEILRVLREEIYYPILKEISAPKKILHNSKESLIDSIRSGRINFSRGQFKGRFSAAVSKELRKLGATWDKKQGSFKLSQSSLPSDVVTAISGSMSRFAKAMSSMDNLLRSVLPDQIAEKMNLNRFFEKTLLNVDKKVRESLSSVTVTPKLSEAQTKLMADEYSLDMKKHIKTFTDKEVTRLRERVQEHSLKGNRYEDIVKEIEKSYGVSHNKAKFLARQETSLMMAKFTESRYLDAGVDEYIWGCVAGSANHPVRPMHKALEGQRFKFTNPPITDENGNRNNPKQDYNCRCYAKPVVRF